MTGRPFRGAVSAPAPRGAARARGRGTAAATLPRDPAVAVLAGVILTLAALAVALACVAGIFHLLRAAPGAPVMRGEVAPGHRSRSWTADPLAPLELGRAGTPGGAAAVPPLDVEALFDAGRRLEAGEPQTLRFRARDPGSGAPASRADLSVSVLHGTDPPRPLPATEVSQGVYEVAWTPGGPGQYRMIVMGGGHAVGALTPRPLGVVGVVGAASGGDAPTDPEIANGRAQLKTGGGRQRR